ncbi:MAG: tRNA pseudouridine(38-40) synthase TruA [Cytophagales bacterium]|nr:MAG: tRNA pseudouridine(38-40) synthase TruA [Cytophagales bacterium]
MRYFLEIAYKGTHFHGWQKQPNALSIQETFEQTLNTLFKTAIPVFASGRTDTGVHAEQQFLQIDLAFELSKYHIHRLNKLLPKDIAIINFYTVKDEATARFDAIYRVYEYRISTIKNPFLQDLVYEFTTPLTIELMNEAAKALLNFEDFQSFSKVKTDVANFNCKIYQAFWYKKDNLLIFKIQANRFLRGMVRAIVGTLLQVGTSKISVSDFESIIQMKNRKIAGPAAPPEGLFLNQVVYPTEIFTDKIPQ